MRCGIVDTLHPDRGICLVDGCNRVQRNRGGNRWGFYCDMHHKAKSGERKRERRIAIETARIIQEQEREAYRNRPEKICNECGGTKVRAEFGKRGNICRVCRNQRPRRPKKYCAISARKTLLRSYGVDADWYNAKFVEQNGCCLICGRHQEKFKTRLAIDHDHTTGAVRGLLCPGCNFLVGRIESGPFLIEKIQLYLKKYSTVRGAG